MTLGTGRTTPIYLYQADAVAVQAWLDTQPLAGAAGAVKEQLDAAITNNSDPIRLELTAEDLAALVAALRTAIPAAARASETAQNVQRILQIAQRPYEGRKWHQKAPPTYW